jgi:methylenetetrahydrofolate dehydrogenase (NADP+) / methenyltetrahydrofolate cyclohydrolase
MIYKNTNLKERFEEYLAFRIEQLEQIPTLFVVQIGDDFASNKYIEYKKRACERLGVGFEHIVLPDNLDEQSIENYINSIPAENSGIIIQLPLPSNLDWLVDLIPISSDIDLLTSRKHILYKKNMLEPTILSIDLVLKDIFGFEASFPNIIEENIDFSGKVVAIIGQGKLVGTPLFRYFCERNATVVSINKDTIRPLAFTALADVVITAAGVENLVDETWLKKDAIVIDAATLESNGKAVGDVNRNSLPKSVLLCPSPGGIGPITILSLIHNLIQISKVL